jgi:hypothetical protein
MFDNTTPEEKAAMLAYNKKRIDEAVANGLTPPKNAAAVDIAYFCSATPEQLEARCKEKDGKPCRCKDGFSIGKMDCCKPCQYFIAFDAWRIYTNSELEREIRVFEDLKKAREAKMIMERNDAGRAIVAASYNLFDAIAKSGLQPVKKPK